MIIQHLPYRGSAGETLVAIQTSSSPAEEEEVGRQTRPSSFQDYAEGLSAQEMPGDKILATAKRIADRCERWDAH